MEPANVFEIINDSSDGMCVDEVTYDGIEISLSDCSSGRAWLDNPCSGSYNGECVGDGLWMNKLSEEATNC